MSCQICLEPYNHSNNKPYMFSSCPHTFCFSCCKKLNGKNCPNCNAKIKDKHLNLALLELIPDINNNQYTAKSETNSLMNTLCQECLNPFDHSLRKPFYFGSCSHTYCLKCIDKLKDKCPSCNVKINGKLPNIALFEFIPESNYDNLKSISLKIINEINEIKRSLKNSREKKTKMHLEKLDLVKRLITSETNQLISKLKSNQDKLLNEAYSLELELIENLNKCDMAVDVDDSKVMLQKNAYNTEQLIDLNNENLKIKNKLNKLAGQLETFKENFEFFLYDNIDLDEPEIGLIRSEKKLNEIYIQTVEKPKFTFEDCADRVAYYKLLIEKFPNWDSPVSEQGTIHFFMSELDDALVCFDKCIELNQSFSIHYINKAQVLEYMQKFDDAIDVLNSAIKLNPYDPDAFFIKGTLFARQKKYKEAIVNFDKAIDLNPNECEKYYGSKGNAYYDMDNYAAASICFSKALEINPAHYEHLRLKGLTLQYTSQFEQAIKCFNECIKLRANLTNPYFWKGQCLLYQREFEACINTLNKALKIVPGNRAFEDMKKIATVCKSNV